MPTIDPKNPKPNRSEAADIVGTLTQKEMLFLLKIQNDLQTRETKLAAKAAQAAARQQAKAERDAARAAAKKQKYAAARPVKIAAAAQPAASDPAAADSPDSAIAVAPKPTSLCHHIMPSGRRCKSVRCNQTRYCYFHSGEQLRKCDRIDGMHANYRLGMLPVIEDRASIQIVLNEIIRSYISDAIDSRKAGILLYGINIALANLRNDTAPVIAEEDAVPAYSYVPEHEPLARLDEEESAAYAAEQKIRMDKLGPPFTPPTPLEPITNASLPQ